MNAIQEHSAYSSHYLYGAERQTDSEEEGGKSNKIASVQNCPFKIFMIFIIILFVFFLIATKAKPLGCMSDALNSASAGYEVLQRQFNDCTNNVELLQKIVTSKNDSNSALSASITSLMVRKIEMSYLVNLIIFSLYFIRSSIRKTRSIQHLLH